jgi:hypothetical protein
MHTDDRVSPPNAPIAVEEAASVRSHVRVCTTPIRRALLAYAGISLMAIAAPVASALGASSTSARPATRSEKSAIMHALIANDGTSAGVHGVYVSRSNPNLGVVCVRTPEAGVRAFVFSHTHHSWRYVTSGRPGSAGSVADRRLEGACG